MKPNLLVVRLQAVLSGAARVMLSMADKPPSVEIQIEPDMAVVMLVHPDRPNVTWGVRIPRTLVEAMVLGMNNARRAKGGGN